MAFSTHGNQIIDDKGTPTTFKGTSWFGFESDVMAPHGLWTQRTVASFLDQVQSFGFNLLRLPYSNDLLKPDAKKSLHSPGSGLGFGVSAHLHAAVQ